MKSPVERIIILDFGSQYTQLIARRIREMHVYCEIVPFDTDPEQFHRDEVRGIVLSGSPASVHDPDAPIPRLDLFNLCVPVLGICYGCQLMGLKAGALIRKAAHREYGPALLEVISPAGLLDGLQQNSLFQVWMSHGDHLETLPQGFKSIARTTDIPFAAIMDPERRLYGVQFHPEVEHTVNGSLILANFVMGICGCKASWTPDRFILDSVEKIQRQVGSGRVLCGLSGGVDSSVVAMLLDKAIDRQLVAVFIDNGVLRAGEANAVETFFSPLLGDRFISVDAANEFITALAGVSDPERKRKIIGHTFIDVFEREAQRLGRIDFLAQGTLYPDIIESVSVRGPSVTIKSHHNVGGLPDKMRLALVEPLRELFKDEVRAVGSELGLPDSIIRRQPFPGPGLAVRILGEVTADRVSILQKADAIVREETGAAGLMQSLWQSFAVLLPVKTVGVMGDERTYENVCAIRAVTSTDAMTADWARLPHDLLARMSTRIINEVKGINRVVYDISSKPPATIEWE
ncbi:glutamine-hydrolyzing GMP synthase [bacterium]|nr:glutamine-hydrolyzing GMP synthase [candidate division CSSED10-310 bacterium]